ncbi:MAG: ATP phosphoribosyltransferase regulatory subunit [Actinomycetota bacterium]
MFESDNRDLVVGFPYGFRDMFPVECRERNIISNLIREQFRLWGYGEVKTPVVEYTRNISAGVGKKWANKLINFFDIDGSLVSLRTDMTIPIARLTGMRIEKDQLPVRFCYFANSFRQSVLQEGVKRVYSQAGLELIGSSSFMADVEILAILNHILAKLGFKDYKVGLGQLQIIEGLCDWFGLSGSQRRFIRGNLVAKNFVNIHNFLEDVDKEKAQVFMSLVKPQQDVDYFSDILTSIGMEKIDQGLDYLKRVYSVLGELGYGGFLLIDLGIVREFDYYTGLLFEVYSAATTDMIGNGGRYDRLIKKFGMEVPATGFALDLDLLHKSMDSGILKDKMKDLKILLVKKTENHAEFIRLSDRIRESGACVELTVGGQGDPLRLAAGKGIGLVCMAGNEPGRVTVFDLGQGTRETMDIKNFIEKINEKKYT